MGLAAEWSRQFWAADYGDPMTNKTPEEERIQKEQEARDKEKEREEAAEERRLE